MSRDKNNGGDSADRVNSKQTNKNMSASLKRMSCMGAKNGEGILGALADDIIQLLTSMR